jgi:hypothetical protein
VAHFTSPAPTTVTRTDLGATPSTGRSIHLPAMAIVTQTNLGTNQVMSPATTQSTSHLGASQFTCLPRSMLRPILEQVPFTCRSIHFACHHSVTQPTSERIAVICLHQPRARSPRLTLERAHCSDQPWNKSHPRVGQFTSSTLGTSRVIFTWPATTIAIQTHLGTSQ